MVVFATAFCFVVFWVFFGLLSPKCAPPQCKKFGRADTTRPRGACIDEPGDASPAAYPKSRNAVAATRCPRTFAWARSSSVTLPCAVAP